MSTAAIHAGLRAQGLATEEDRRALHARVTGKAGLAEMTPRGRAAVLAELRRLGFRPAPRADRLAGPFAAKLRALWVAGWLAFGGAEMHFAQVPTARGQLVRAVGPEAAARLAAELGGRRLRVPLAKPWLARMLAAEGLSTAEIARQLRWSDVAVRRALRAQSQAGDARQLRLFG